MGGGAADVVVGAAIAEDFAAADPGADWEADEFDAVPGAPAAFRELLVIANCVATMEVDQYEIGVIALFDAALVDDVPDAGRGVAHPLDDLLQAATAAVDFVEHQR